MPSLQMETNSVRIDGRCRSLEQPVVSGHLKTVEIQCGEVNETVVKILKILAVSGISPEQVNIQITEFPYMI